VKDARMLFIVPFLGLITVQYIRNSLCHFWIKYCTIYREFTVPFLGLNIVKYIRYSF